MDCKRFDIFHRILNDLKWRIDFTLKEGLGWAEVSVFCGT